MITVVDNFNNLNIDTITNKKDRNQYLDKNKYFCLSDRKPKELSVSLNDYLNKSSMNIFFSFFKDSEKIDSKNGDDLIISIKKDGENYKAQTGNYIGKFIWDGLEIDIKSRFSNTFLERMLNFADDIFLDDVSITGKQTNNDLEISKYIIYYMFIQNLEKAFLLGLPKSYMNINNHEMKLKGKIDINRFIKNDIPFKGKISSISREQKEIHEIIDVLFKAIKIIDKNKFNTKNISHIKTHIKQYRSNKYVSNQTINKALKSKALKNPIFAPYKKVLEYAKYIIDNDNIEENKDGNSSSYGFLINVAELFEIYITKLLRNKFSLSGWSIESPKINLNKEFGNSYLYQRKIIPDITMINESTKKIMVFDTKYKRMLFRDIYGNGVDIDRNDFFQINTYMSYYQNRYNDYDLITGGLLYPIEKEYKFEECYNNNWFGNYKTSFIIDGIDLSKDNNQKNFLLESEEKFLLNIGSLI